MKMYKIFGAVSVFGGLIGSACLCGAIECRTSIFWPVLILLVSGVCGYVAYRETGRYFEYYEYDE